MGELMKRDRQAIAMRIAEDIPEGWTVNLGIGIPLTVADCIPPEREVMIHSENGIVGVGPRPPVENIDPWVVNAGKEYVTLRAGASLFNQAESFGMIRGGHIDLCILGAFEVSARGDLANWTLSSGDRLPGVGGAMDLAAGAKRIWVTMDHVSRNGRSKIVESCTLPLTAPGVVSRIYTDLAVLEITSEGVRVVEIVDGLSFAELQEMTGAKIRQ